MKTEKNIPNVTGYKVVVLSGTYCCEIEDFGDAVGRCHEVSACCGHIHRTAGAAEKCREKLLGYNRITRTCSAKWYNSIVVPTYRGYEDTHLVISVK